MGVIYDKFKKQDWAGLAEYLSKESSVTFPVLQYLSVAIDSGTELEYRLRMGVVGEGKGVEEIPSQPDYLRTQERFRKMYRAFRDLPISLVMTAGVRELKEDSTGIIKRSPDFQPALAHDLIRMTDLIAFMAVTMTGAGADAKWERHLVVSSSQRYVARDRSGKLPPMLAGEKFQWGKLLDKILT
jgi:hypothetical protein